MSESVAVQIITTNKSDDNQDNTVIEAMILKLVFAFVSNRQVIDDEAC